MMINMAHDGRGPRLSGENIKVATSICGLKKKTLREIAVHLVSYLRCANAVSLCYK